MMARAKPSFALRPFLPEDTPLLAEIFRASVEGLTEDDYNPAQQDAWAAEVDDLEAFAERLGRHLTLIATMDGSPVGFITLDNPTDIGLFYVHPAVAGHGAGAILYDAIEKLAASRGTPHLAVDASDTALHFFRDRGFAAQQRNTVSVGNEWLSNTTMKKSLARKERAS
jgi:putative acetyltransferase